MAKNPSDDEQPRDVLAAEEFPLGDGDAHAHPPEEEPHDVLAADEFAVPAPDPELHEEHAHDHDHDHHGHDHSHGPGGHAHAHPHPYGAGAGPLQLTKKQIVAAGAAIGSLLLIVTRRLRGRRGED